MIVWCEVFGFVLFIKYYGKFWFCIMVDGKRVIGVIVI